ncbi:hypothetical protein V2J09_004683 [Rumex salicifolius]
MDFFKLGLVLAHTIILWNVVICVTGCQSPGTVVLSGSMEPAFKRGDNLLVYMSKDPIRVGEIIVFNVDGFDTPIVHRVIKVHENKDTGKVDIMTKGDNNRFDDSNLYPRGQLWLQQHHIIGRAVGYLPYVGWFKIIMIEKPFIKFIGMGAMGLVWLVNKYGLVTKDFLLNFRYSLKGKSEVKKRINVIKNGAAVFFDKNTDLES